MKDNQGNWTEEAILVVWEKAPMADCKSADLRLDPCKALIKWDEYGYRNSDFGWEIDHVVPEKLLKDNGVPQELIDHIDNLRPMHWSNNLKKSDDFPKYGADTTKLGNFNFDNATREYCVNFDLINVVKHLYADYIDIKHPTTLDQWLADTNYNAQTSKNSSTEFFDDIVTYSIHDLD